MGFNLPYDLKLFENHQCLEHMMKYLATSILKTSFQDSAKSVFDNRNRLARLKETLDSSFAP